MFAYFTFLIADKNLHSCLLTVKGYTHPYTCIVCFLITKMMSLRWKHVPVLSANNGADPYMDSNIMMEDLHRRELGRGDTDVYFASQSIIEFSRYR